MKGRNTLLRALLAAALCVCMTLPAAAQTFPDVPTSHWAYAQIERAAADGAVKGYANGTFAPAASLSLAHFTVILTRSFYAAELERASAGSSQVWYAPAEQVARAHNLLSGISVGMSDPLSRYNMAVELYNFLLDHNAKVSESDLSKSASSIRDLSKFPSEFVRNAVLYSYALGLLGGYSDGTFRGDNILNRGQAAAIYCRLKDALKNLPQDNSPVDVPTPGRDNPSDNTPDDSGKPVSAPEVPDPTPPDDNDDPVDVPEVPNPAPPDDNNDPVDVPEVPDPTPPDDNDDPDLPPPDDGNDESVSIPEFFFGIRRK